MSLCELTDLLDPRPRAEAAGCPILKAANIPLSELPKRMHELPAKGTIVKVCDLGVLAGDTVMLLEDRGHQCEIVPFEYENGFSQGRQESRDDDEPISGVAWRSANSAPRYRLWAPNRFLMSVAGGLNPGKAVDLGCGSGRDAVALADLGWHVTGVDVLPDAVEKGKDLLRRYAPQAAQRVCWRVCDIGQYEPEPSSSDLVACVLFFDPRALEIAANALKPGGLFVCETFTVTHREKHGSPQERRALTKTALEGHPCFEVVHWSEGWQDDRHLAQAVVRRL